MYFLDDSSILSQDGRIDLDGSGEDGPSSSFQDTIKRKLNSSTDDQNKSRKIGKSNCILSRYILTI
jgi:hypothetical protein